MDAAPLAAANASSSSILSPSNNDTTPHTILSDVISSYQAKLNKTQTSSPSPSTSPAVATANLSATTVDAAPLVAVQASPTVTPSSPNKDANNIHTILADELSAYKAKFHQNDTIAAAPSSSPAIATATAAATAMANATADGGDDYYNTPCSSGPNPSQYEAFVQVSMHV